MPVEPTTIYAGDFLNWVREWDSCYYTDKDGITQYLKASTCTLNYYLVNKDTKIQITAVATSDDYEVSVASTTTENWQPSLYYWSAIITHTTGATTKQWTVDQGTINVLHNFTRDGITEYDGRSHIKRVLDALEAAIEGRADKQMLDWISYSIAGKSRAIDSRELRTWYIQYKSMYEKEVAEKNLERGLPSANRILVRL